MRIIGLTGGIGSGKSTVSQYLQDQGAVLLDADKVGHESYQPGTPTYKDLVAAFGDRIVAEDKSINRKELGSIVFSDPAQLQRLNSIVHPRMYEMMAGSLKDMERDGVKAVVIEAAILYEAKWESLVDEVWVTVAPENVVVKRVHERNGFPEDQIRARIKSQMSNEERSARADVVIDTDCTLDEVRSKVQSLWKQRTSAAG